jgi:hypothetical protein
MVQTRASSKNGTVIAQEKILPQPPILTATSKINMHQLAVMSIGSWNVQGGIKSGQDFQCVAKDLGVRNVDIGCLQETYCSKGESMDCEEGRVICLEDSSKPNQRHYGLGFFVGKSLAEHVVDYKPISNRIALLRLHNVVLGGSSNPRGKFSIICVVNVYAPTAQRALQKKDEYEDFYKQLNETLRACYNQSSFVVVAGDFNSKLGLRGQSEGGVKESFMGNFGKGTRNRNGNRLASFLSEHKLYAANTHCRNSMRHRTTWNGVTRSFVDGTPLRIFLLKNVRID